MPFGIFPSFKIAHATHPGIQKLGGGRVFLFRLLRLRRWKDAAKAGPRRA